MFNIRSFADYRSGRLKKDYRVPLALALTAIIALEFAPPLAAPANAETRFERAVAAAAGRAAGRVASHMAARAALIGAERAKLPACRAGARELRLRGLRRMIFVAECKRLL
jgi:hypothetical protein